MPQENSDRLHPAAIPVRHASQLHTTWDHWERLPIPVCVLDAKGVVLAINLAARDLLSVLRSEMLAESLANKIHPEDQSLFRETVMQAKGSVHPAECELRLLRENATIYWVSMSVAQAESEGPSALLVVLKDVSRSKENEITLRKSNDRFRHAIEATRDGIWDWDIPSGRVFFSPQWARLLGYEPDEVPARVEFFFAILHTDDVERVNRELEAHLSGRKPVKQDEVRLKTKSGEYRWFLDRGEVVERDAAGNPIRMVGTITDITQSREARDSLLKSQSQTRLLIESAQVGLWDWDIQSNETYFSPEWKAQLGYGDHELRNHFDEWKSRLHPDDVGKTLQRIDAFFANRIPSYELEFRLKHRDGSWRWIFARADVHRDPQGQPIRMLGCHVDITDRKEAEHAIRRSLSLMRATLESTTDGILVVNVAGEIEIYNQVFLNMWKVPQELIANGQESVALPCALELLQDPDQFLAKMHYLYSHPEETSFDTLQLKDGRVIERYSCPQLIDGKVVGRVWSFRDVTERLAAEAAQREALSRLQKIASRLPGVVYQFRLRPDGSMCFPYASEGMRDLFGIDPLQLQENSETDTEIIDKAGILHSIEHSARNLTPWVHEFQVLHKDGTLRWYSGNSLPERDPDGSTTWHGFITDITDRKLADAKLRESERRLNEAQAISQIGNFHWDAITQRVTWSDQLYRLYKKDPTLFEPTFESYLAMIHPEDRPRVLQELQVAMNQNASFDHQYRICLEGEEPSWVHARGIAIVDSDGSFLGLEGTCQDISEQKRAEAMTASLEAQLRESQKMEAIGTLAGGIAHDFNNILASILGNVEIAISRASFKDSVLEECLHDIRKAGERARDLVQQILSFSRRQPTNRTPISLAPIIEEAGRLLFSTLPARLNLEVDCQPHTPHVLADATQIEQVILNLVTNSMQAMVGRRGSIRILLDATDANDPRLAANAQLRAVLARSAGPLVRLRVSDDGPGMCPETIHRIFEPFFTTKATDEGTGLGLSVVHGIVQSHDGVVMVESQLEHGATFTIYLPSTQTPMTAVEETTPNAALSTTESPSPHRILYLDDDQGVLNVVSQILELRGYRLESYDNTDAALDAFLRRPLDFDLLVTDYNMPGMHGLELAREIRQVRDELPIIITSGYIDSELISGANACSVQELIPKPFRFGELCAAIDRLLNVNRNP